MDPNVVVDEPAGGQAGPQGPAQSDDDRIKPYKDSPSHGTRDRRPSQHIRDNLRNLVGLKICIISNKMTAPWEVHSMHVACRSLKETWPTAFKCLRNSVGEIGPNGKKDINLDHVGNVEFAHTWVHDIFDGPPFHSKEGGYGKGDWAFAPADFEKNLQHIEANRGMDYKQLFPMSDGPHEYIMYGFPNEHQHVFGRYADSERTYAHSLNSGHDYDKDGSVTTDGDGTNDGSANEHDDETIEESPTWAAIHAAYKREQYAVVEKRTLIVGDQGFKIISHLNPVFVIFDYAAKMHYRLTSGYAESIPSEDAKYFWKRVWPVVQCWFEPEDADKGDDLPATRSRTAKAGPAQSEVVIAQPVTPEPVRQMWTNRTGDGEMIIGNESNEETAREPQPGLAIWNNERSEAGGPSEPASVAMPPDGQDAARETAGTSDEPLSTAQSVPQRSALKKSTAQALTTRTLRFADDDRASDDNTASHDAAASDDAVAASVTGYQLADNATEETIASAADPPPVAPAIDTPATPAPAPQVIAPAQPTPDAQPQLRRTTRANVGRRLPPAPPPPPRPTRAAPKRSGKAKTTTSTVPNKSAKSAAPLAPSTSGQGSRELRSRAKETGDKRARDDNSSDDDDADLSESDEVPQTKKARIKKGKTRADEQPHAGPSKSRGQTLTPSI
ncbi:hypothetical protein HDZ31DRAFT_63591 [Schizophyllum fasciatum]